MILSAADRISLILGRAIQRAEFLADRVQELEEAAKVSSDETEQQTADETK